MFERFTEGAIKTIMLAQEESRRLGHNFVGSEQLLLGLIGEKKGIAAVSLDSMGVKLKQAREEAEKIIGRGSGFVSVEIPFTPRAKEMLEKSWDEARRLKQNYIGTEHLLLGLIAYIEMKDPPAQGVAAQMLMEMNVDLKQLKTLVLTKIQEAGKNPGTSSIESRQIQRERDTQICPNCAEEIKSNAIMCRFCYAGVSTEQFRPCPFCAEMVRKKAKLCRYCSSELPQVDS